MARKAAAVAAPSTPARATLRQVARAVPAAWSDEINREIDIIADLLIALAGKSGRLASGPRDPCEGIKQQVVPGLLHRDEAATIAQITEVFARSRDPNHGYLTRSGHGAGTPVRTP